MQTLERRSSIERDPSAVAALRPSAAEFAAQAAEISRLGELIGKEIDQSPQSDQSELADKLKKIEKLSKQLRSQVETSLIPRL